MSDYQLERIDDHVEQADKLFIQQFRNKPRLSALLAAFTARCQELEDTLWDIFDTRFIERAEGTQLDVLGRIVGQVRIGPDDATYRVFIRTRIIANKSRGRPDDMIAVAASALQGLAFEYRELYPTSWIVDVLDPLTAHAMEIADILRSTKPAGTGGSLHFRPTTSSSGSFRFSSSSTATPDTAHGWGAGKWISTR